MIEWSSVSPCTQATRWLFTNSSNYGNEYLSACRISHMRTSLVFKKGISRKIFSPCSYRSGTRAGLPSSYVLTVSCRSYKPSSFSKKAGVASNTMVSGRSQLARGRPHSPSKPMRTLGDLILNKQEERKTLPHDYNSEKPPGCCASS